MNLSLDFTLPEPLALNPTTPTAPLAARFVDAMQQDGSPVRAVRHQPAKSARFGEFPVGPQSRLANRLGWSRH